MKIDLCKYKITVHNRTFTGFYFFRFRYLILDPGWKPIKLDIPKKGEYFASESGLPIQCLSKYYQNISLIIKKAPK